MAEKLKSGYQIRTVSGMNVRVKKWLAGGGQGDVYLVDYNGKDMALKWYHASIFTVRPSKTPVSGEEQLRRERDRQRKNQDFYDNIKSNIARGAPSDEFLWPKDVTPWQDGTFGYIMDLIPRGYYELSEYRLLHVHMSSFKTVIDAALHIVTAYRMLHNHGYSYQDLNDGNFLIEPTTGKVLICDNDNVAPNGTQTGILGKPRYMAPEVVTGQAMPNDLTDRFSMSIILYMLFCLDHPLEGKRNVAAVATNEFNLRLYGTQPLFMMDPDDQSNGPDRVQNANSIRFWSVLPDYMKELFQRAFGQRAIHNPAARPKELDWIKAFVRFRSEIVACKCGNEVFTKDGLDCRCDKCKKPLGIAYRLALPDYTIPAVPGSRIYRCQVGITNADKALEPMAAIISKNNDPTMLGMRHRGSCSWDAVNTRGEARRVAPGDVIPLKDGIQVAMRAEPGETGTKVCIRSNKK